MNYVFLYSVENYADIHRDPCRCTSGASSERRALGQMYNRGHRWTLTQEPCLDQSEALGLVGPQIKVFLIAQQSGVRQSR
jgi:hypothetical protein